MKKHLKKGFSLVEMLLVLGVLAVFLVATFYVYPKVKESAQVSREVKNLNLIKSGLVQYFNHNGNNYSILGTAGKKEGNVFANQAKIVPPTMRTDASDLTILKNSWGGDVAIASTNYKHEQYEIGRNFAIWYYEVPSSACVSLATEAGKSFIQMQIAGTAVSSGGELKIDNLVKSCNSSPTVTIAFIDR